MLNSAVGRKATNATSACLQSFGWADCQAQNLSDRGPASQAIPQFCLRIESQLKERRVDVSMMCSLDTPVSYATILVPHIKVCPSTNCVWKSILNGLVHVKSMQRSHSASPIIMCRKKPERSKNAMLSVVRFGPLAWHVRAGA